MCECVSESKWRLPSEFELRSQRLAPSASAAGLPETFVFHDLRHCAASLLLAAGVDLKTIQIQLGHSDYSITANTYSHLLPNAQAAAAHKLNNLLEQVQPAATVDLSTSHPQNPG